MNKTGHFKHNRTILTLLLATTLLLIGVSGCKSSQNGSSNKNTGIDNVHTSRNSLDWAGVYQGQLPCHDCRFVDAVLTLNNDETYQLIYSYEGKGDSSYVTNGVFSWDKTGSRISIRLLENNVQSFRVVENGLVPLDQKGIPLEGEFAFLNRFKKTGQNMIQEKYWKLIQLGGKTIHFTGSKEPHMILKLADSAVRGFAGCNGFGGHYEILPGNRIRFSQLISTKMACPDLEIENAFMRVLEKADNYTQHGDTLYLNKARMAPLAQFVAVYL